MLRFLKEKNKDRNLRITLVIETAKTVRPSSLMFRREMTANYLKNKYIG